MLSTNTLIERPPAGERPIQEHLEPANYQVFLSFQGSDTRQGFVNCLYNFLTEAGFLVFKDDEENPLDKKILEAIKISTICIPVFSEDYASSKWRLRELAKMIELNKKIIPIFYDVTLDDVTLKTSLYVNALEALRIEIDGRELSHDCKSKLQEETEQWAKALREVGTYTGRELKNTGHADFCKSIIKEVSSVLNINEKIVIDHHLVGMDAYVETMLNLLDVETHDVRHVGIHGMGGVGKTTLAGVIFNRLSPCFEYSSFLANIRELSQREGMDYLQKQLLSDLGCQPRDVWDSEVGAEMIMDTSRDKKVLIVLDDVSHNRQIDKLAGDTDWFAPGSRIIITSRDKHVLEFDGGASLEQSKGQSTMKMQEMSFDEALQLFSWHAFGTDLPPYEYIDLAKEVVSVSGSLPVSLEIIGSLLRGKCKDDWKEKINTLGRIPDKNIQQKLIISYEALDLQSKQMFLDIACFLVNKNKTNAIYFWEACNVHPQVGMEDLISLSLVKIVDNKFWMHDYLRDLGRDIVYSENVTDPGKRSRLWNHEEAFRILDNREGTEAVELLGVSYHGFPQDWSYTRELHFSELVYRVLSCIFCPLKVQDRNKSFNNLRNLRLLELWRNRGGMMLDLVGDFRGLLQNLRWLSWDCCPSRFNARNLNLVNLVVLDLSRNRNIKGDWDGWSKMKIGNNLKVLDLSHCSYLVRIPDLSKYTSLEKLILEGCCDLIEISSSIGMVKALKHLNIRGCNSLRGVPDELCSLENLEEILVRSPHLSFALPREIGDLKSLANLELVEAWITDLPASIHKLNKLKRLSLRGCHRVSELPDSMGDLVSLVELDISGTRIGELPASIRRLKKLKRVHLFGRDIIDR